jgi:hypothetical protein
MINKVILITCIGFFCFFFYSCESQSNGSPLANDTPLLAHDEVGIHLNPIIPVNNIQGNHPVHINIPLIVNIPLLAGAGGIDLNPIIPVNNNNVLEAPEDQSVFRRWLNKDSLFVEFSDRHHRLLQLIPALSLASAGCYHFLAGHVREDVLEIGSYFVSASIGCAFSTIVTQVISLSNELTYAFPIDYPRWPATRFSRKWFPTIGMAIGCIGNYLKPIYEYK